MNAADAAEWLTLAECAAWLRLSSRKLAALSKGPRPLVPGHWFNRRVVRFHKPTLVAHLTDPERVVSLSRARAGFGQARQPRSPLTSAASGPAGVNHRTRPFTKT